MEESKKKSKTGLIILIIIILLILLFLVWYFLIRDNGKVNGEEGDNTTKVTSTPVPANTKKEYDYRDGVLTTIVDENGNPKQNDVIIDGIILIGNRHGYFDTDDTDTILNNFVKQGYKKEGINSSFYLNEHIEMYLDTKYSGANELVKVLITPHKKVEEYEKMSITELEELASEKGSIVEYNGPDNDNNKYIGDPYVSIDYEEGKYDILFIYKDSLAYFVTIELSVEPV